MNNIIYYANIENKVKKSYKKRRKIKMKVELF